MSLINDALKRAQESQEQSLPRSAPGPALRPVEPGQPSRFGVGILLPAFGVVGALAIFLAWRWQQTAPPGSPESASRSAELVVQAKAPPPPVLPTPPVLPRVEPRVALLPPLPPPPRVIQVASVPPPPVSQPPSQPSVSPPASASPPLVSQPSVSAPVSTAPPRVIQVASASPPPVSQPSVSAPASTPPPTLAATRAPSPVLPPPASPPPTQLVPPASSSPTQTVAKVETATSPVEKKPPVFDPLTPVPALIYPPQKLQVIIFDPKRPSASISGQTVFVGDKVGEFVVQSITVDTVTLVGGGKTNVLGL